MDNNKPSFWLFLKTIFTLNLNKYKLEIYNKKSKVLTFYDVNLFYRKGLFRWFNLIFVIPIWAFNLQIKHMLRPMGLMPNLVYELLIIELAIIAGFYILVIYCCLYRKLDFPIIEERTNVLKKDAITKGSTARKWVMIVGSAVILLYFALNSYTVTYIRSITNKELNNPENILLLADRGQEGVIEGKEGDISFVGGTSSAYVEDEYMLIEIRVTTTPLPVRAYLNGEELEVTLRKFDEKPFKYSAKYHRFFWESLLFYRRVLVNISDEKLKRENTFKIICGEIEKTYQINTDK